MKSKRKNTPILDTDELDEKAPFSIYPRELDELLEAGAISPIEFIMLIRIGGLCKYGGDGCYAENKWFSKRLNGRSEEQISRIIARLISCGLLVAKYRYKGKRRMLWTIWAFEYTQVKTQAGTIIKRKRDKKPCLMKISSTHLMKISTPYSNKGLVSRNTYSITRSRAGSARDSEDDMFIDEDKTNSRTSPKKWDCLRADYLHNKLVEANKAKRRFSLKAWSNEIRLLRESVDGDKDRVKAVLEYYCRHIGERYMPLAFSAKSFRDKFFKIESQMLRAAEEVGEEKPKPKKRALSEREARKLLRRDRFA